MRKVCANRRDLDLRISASCYAMVIVNIHDGGKENAKLPSLSYSRPNSKQAHPKSLV